MIHWTTHMSTGTQLVSMISIRSGVMHSMATRSARLLRGIFTIHNILQNVWRDEATHWVSSGLHDDAR